MRRELSSVGDSVPPTGGPNGAPAIAAVGEGRPGAHAPGESEDGPQGAGRAARAVGAPGGAGPAAHGGRHGVERLRALVRWESGLVLLVAGVALLGINLSSSFLGTYNLLSLGLSNGEIAIMCLPLTLIIITGEIDLSITSTLALSSSVLGYLWERHWPMPGIIVTVLVLGALLGLINGLLVTRFGLPSLAVTIGTLTLYAGVAEIVLGSTIVADFPSSYTTIGVNAFPHTDLSYSVVFFAVLAVVFGVVLHATPLGRSIFAIGLSSEAALFAGISVKRVKTLLFVVSGVVSSFAGVIYTFRLNTAEFDNGSGLVLSCVAIVLLGGVSIFGGKGSLLGVVLAVLVFAGLQNALLLTSFPQDASGIVTGGLLLAAILLQGGALVDWFARLRQRQQSGRMRRGGDLVH
ncbi:MAG TPA: ABC transporter permease [Acidimicrobiales bacterium]|nr:ABC transporter permease [Acidimicrobiales bacterium]